MLDAGAPAGPAQLGVGETDLATEYPFRSGGYALSLFSKALYGLILRALSERPLRLADLRRAVGGPAQTTLRGNLDTLFDMGALEKQRANGRANMVDNALTPMGKELLFVADSLERWLARAPSGALQLDREIGKAAIKALVNGWDSTMLRALAVRPFSLTELDNLISSFSYPALERRLAAMRLAGIVTPAPGNGSGTPYVVTEWLRQAMAPLLAAVRCERRHMGEQTAPLTRVDIETILLLATPLVALPTNAAGTLQLAVDGGAGAGRRSAGVRLSIGAGQIVRCTSKLESNAESWIRGSASDWLDAMVEGESEKLDTGGDRALALDLVDTLHRALFLS
jgi:DNA-binding HxlR family transcriptional regulator